MAEPIRSILVAGGGTAGWMAAAALNRALGPSCTVSLVESDDIGIVGVGEATVPPIRDFNTLIDLNEAEFMRECKATLKLGIEFVNWGEVGCRYFHAFGPIGPGPTLAEFQQSFLALRASGRLEDDLEPYSLCSQAMKAGKVGARDPDPRSPLNSLFSAYHFDAGLYARYLRRVCEARGVKRIEGEIVEVLKRPADGFVSGLKLDDGQVLEADLFIDCTGFRALLIEGALETGFEDWSHWLPMNRAWAVPCERAESTTPYTRSTARSAGWQWRIPLQHRIGNGHVYCNGFMGDDEARQILLDNLDGAPLADPRQLKFTTGRRKAFWARNVVALGLSSGFIEPLESTSIHMVQSGIYRLLQHFPDSRFSAVNIEAYNRRLGAEIELIRDFVILHYHATQRADTPFWRTVASMPVPDSLSQRVETFRDRGLLYQSGADEYFSQSSWLAVMFGQGIRPRGFNPLYGLQNPDQGQRAFSDIARRYQQAVSSLAPHDDFLKAKGCWAT